MTSNRIRPNVTPVTAAAETLLARHGLNAEDVANQRADTVIDVERSGYWQEVAREIRRIVRRTKHSTTIHRTRDRAGRVRHYVVRFGKRYPMSEQEVREAMSFHGWTVVDDARPTPTTPTKESETMTENQNQTETPTDELETLREALVEIARCAEWSPGNKVERLERIASLARRVVDAPPTNDQIRHLRLRAWNVAERASILLRDYAVTAENYEQPRMSDDAIDAGDLAAKMREYSHRFEDDVDAESAERSFGQSFAPDGTRVN